MYTTLPSSHSSTPAWTLPSPQFGEAQVLSQSSSSTMLPSSHASPGPTKPSPHTAFLQALVQGSVSSAFASSHSSPSSTLPSPQKGAGPVLPLLLPSLLLPSLLPSLLLLPSPLVPLTPPVTTSVVAVVSLVCGPVVVGSAAVDDEFAVVLPLESVRPALPLPLLSSPQAASARLTRLIEKTPKILCLPMPIHPLSIGSVPSTRAAALYLRNKMSGDRLALIRTERTPPAGGDVRTPVAHERRG